MSVGVGTTADMTANRDRLLPHIDSSEIVELASGLVRFPSAAPNEGAVAEFLADWMLDTGVFDDVFLQHVIGGRYNVIGIVRGADDGPTVVLNGHLDQGEPRAGWSREPFDPQVDDGWLYGMGLTDMKGGVASQVVAALAIARSGIPHRGDIMTTSVMYHDTVGLGTKFFLDSWDGRIAAAICGEPTALAIQVAHGGAWQFELRVETESHHVSRGDGDDGAIPVMIDLLHELRRDDLFTMPEETAIVGLPRMVVGVIEGGWRPARTADVCTAKGDVRTVPGMTAASLRSDFIGVIRSVTERHTGARITLRELAYQRPFVIEPDAPIVDLVTSAHRAVTGEVPLIGSGLPVAAYVTDSSDFARLGIPTALYGPGDWTAGPDERIRISEMATSAAVYALAALHLSR